MINYQNNLIYLQKNDKIDDCPECITDDWQSPWWLSIKDLPWKRQQVFDSMLQYIFLKGNKGRIFENSEVWYRL